MSAKDRYQHWPPLLLWTLFWLLFFAPLLLGASRLPSGDFTGQFHAFGLFQARELAAGRLPVWSPGSYAGFPFAADTQAALFYPPRLLTILFSLPWNFPLYALQLEGLIHIWLAGTFSYLLAYDMVRRRSAALVAAVAFGLGGYLTSYPLLQLAILETITWLPLVLWLLRQGVQRLRPLPWLLAAGLFLGVGGLAGHPQTWLHISYVAAAYYLFLAWRARWRWSSILGFGAVMAIVTVGTASASWLSALRYLSHTTRDNVAYEFVSNGFPLLDYLQSLVPGTLSFWTPQYVGLITIALALWACWGRRGAHQSEVIFWATLALISGWLSLGDKGILFELFYRLAPGFRLFRQQERLVGVLSLSLALLAAQGTALWQQASLEESRAMVKRLGYTLSGGLFLSGSTLLVARQLAIADWWRIWIRQGLVTAAFILLWLIWARQQTAKPHGQWWSLALLLTLGVDLYFSVSGAMHLQPDSPSIFWPQPAWLESVATAEPSRIDSGSLFQANIGEIYGLEDVRGISPLKGEALARFEQLPRGRMWRLLNVGHVLMQDDPVEGLSPVDTITSGLVPGESLEATVYRVDGALPRAWMVYQPLLADDAEAAWQVLQSPDFDPASQVVFHKRVEGLDTVRPPAVNPVVRKTRLAANALTISVSTETPGVLVISEWAYPGWQALIGGEPVVLHRADYALQALMLPAGTHTVELRFAPWDISAGLAISVFTLLLALVAAWRWRPMAAVRQVSRKRGQVAMLPRPSYPYRNLWSRPSIWLWSLTLLLLIGAGLRLYTSATQELRGDEAFSFLFARQPVVEIVRGLIEVGETLPPFHYLALHYWAVLVGKTEVALRYMSVLIGVLMLALMFQLGRQLKDRVLGLLVVALMAPSQLLIWVSQDVRNTYAWTPVLAIVATLSLLWATQSAQKRPSPWRWALYILTCTITLYSHYHGFFVLLGHALYVLGAAEKRRFLKPWLLSGLVVFLLLVPWPSLLWSHWLAAGHLSDPSTPELMDHLVTLGQALSPGSAFDRPIGRWLFLVSAGLALLGFVRLRTRRPDWALLLAGWLGGAILILYLARFQRAIFNDYYIVAAAPAWWLMLATGLRSLWRGRRRWSRPAGALALLALLVGSGLSLGNYYFEPAYNRSTGYRDLAAYLADSVQPGDGFIVHFPDPAIEYYLEGVPLPRYTIPTRQGEPQGEIEAELSSVAAKHDRLWFIPYHHSIWDPDDVVPSWLNYNLLHEQETHYDKATLQAFRPLHAVESVLTPVDVALGDRLRLLGAFITVDGLPADLKGTVSLKPESRVEVTLLWSALRPIPENYTVFVHLLDEYGNLVTQHDGIPVLGTRPTPSWSTGERLLDRHELVVPPTTADSGKLIVGMYRTETIERQLFTNTGDAVPLANVSYR